MTEARPNVARPTGSLSSLWLDRLCRWLAGPAPSQPRLSGRRLARLTATAARAMLGPSVVLRIPARQSPDAHPASATPAAKRTTIPMSGGPR